MLNTNRVMLSSISIRPGRDFSPTYNRLIGMINVLWPGGATVV